jgi:hypothetical protein
VRRSARRDSTATGTAANVTAALTASKRSGAV